MAAGTVAAGHIAIAVKHDCWATIGYGAAMLSCRLRYLMLKKRVQSFPSASSKPGVGQESSYESPSCACGYQNRAYYGTP